MESSNPIINLGDLAKPADTLIKKISDAIGGIFKPYQIRRVAQAKSEAEKMKAVAQIEITELQHRAMQRFFIEEAKKQNNIESITSKALPLLGEKSKPDEIENDWITNFFDKCRLISDDDMQIIWSKILAGESNSPGKYSKRTIDILSSMDKVDADLFTKLCNFSINLSELCPLVYDTNDKIYNSNGIYFGTLTHLESIGLIRFDHLAGFLRTDLKQSGYITYFSEKIWIELSTPENNEMDFGKVMLTNVGNQLANLCGIKPIDGFVNYLKDKWQELGYMVFDKKPPEKVKNA